MDSVTSLDSPVSSRPDGSLSPRMSVEGSRIALWALLLGMAILALPTMMVVSRESWNTEHGSHGPIVLMTGAWLLVRLWPRAVAVAQNPPLYRVVLLLALLLPGFVVAHITQIVEVDSYLMYASLLTALYSVIGGAGMRKLWFPLFYMSFMFPPPDTIVYGITMPLKMGISQFAINLLHWFGLPIGGQGVMIYVGQYSLLVAAACSGLNSIIALGAISLFYIYIRHEAEWHYALVLTLVTVPVALIANFVRVLCLILLTYYAGEAAAQGFLHNFAGLLMFSVALGSMFAIDVVLKHFWDRMAGKPASTQPTQAAI